MLTLLNASNDGFTRLVADVTATDTFLDVEDASKFPDPPFRVWINEEIIEVRAIDRVTNRFSELVRGAEGTTPAFHPIGSLVENVFTAGTYQELVDAINSVDEKIGPVEQKANQNADSILQLQQQVNEHLNDIAIHKTSDQIRTETNTQLKVEVVSSSESETPEAGRIIFDVSQGKFLGGNGSEWV